MASFKIGCKTTTDEPWAYNALRFATKAEAEIYARDLYVRWTALREWEVHPSDDDPTHLLEMDGDQNRPRIGRLNTE